MSVVNKEPIISYWADLPCYILVFWFLIGGAGLLVSAAFSFLVWDATFLLGFLNWGSLRVILALGVFLGALVWYQVTERPNDQ